MEPSQQEHKPILEKIAETIEQAFEGAHVSVPLVDRADDKPKEIVPEQEAQVIQETAQESKTEEPVQEAELQKEPEENYNDVVPTILLPE